MVGKLVKHVCFGSRACCVFGNGRTCCDQKCVRSNGQVCCVHGKSQVRLHANLVSPRMCASSGDHCNLLCCEESNHSGFVNYCELISTGTKEPSKPEVCGLPQHLRSLYERSVAHLDDQQAVEVYQLLNEFADTFSKGAGDLGRTDLVKHQINTGDAAPIRQPPRRLPFAKREVSRAIGEIYKQGVIEPSSSPWSSPVVLVKRVEDYDFVLTIGS